MQEFGFLMPKRSIMVSDVRVKASRRGRGNSLLKDSNLSLLMQESVEKLDAAEKSSVSPTRIDSIWFQDCGRLPTGIYPIDSLKPGDVVFGPAVLLDENTTVLGSVIGCSDSWCVCSSGTWMPC